LAALADGNVMNEESSRQPARDYVPAAPQLWLYDFLVAVLARESRWRPALLRQIDPQNTDAIADIGCGTGTLIALIGRAVQPATLVGIDPDPAILERARRKAGRGGATAEFKLGYARDAAALLDGLRINKVVSSLVFHQVPMDEKRAGLAAMRAALVPGGELHVADYGLQRTPVMRMLFRIVQKGDGFENTEPNAQGVLPELMTEVGFRGVEETAVVRTPTGSISLYRATREP
jgi:ubiquinone/menaquinone biosynthesis C-methylase UbiE